MTAAELDIEREDGHRTLTHDGTEATHTHGTALSSACPGRNLGGGAAGH